MPLQVLEAFSMVTSAEADAALLNDPRQVDYRMNALIVHMFKITPFRQAPCRGIPTLRLLFERSANFLPEMWLPASTLHGMRCEIQTLFQSSAAMLAVLTGPYCMLQLAHIAVCLRILLARHKKKQQSDKTTQQNTTTVK
jgi:hypothetical protein